MPRDAETLALIALSVDEYDQIVSLLDREPNDVELGMFGAMWSEHCGYKNSKPLLRLFPSTGPRVLTQRGGENAGAVDIGGGYCAVFKTEPPTPPSAVEPSEGAATGPGGIVRDIFAMGARPFALLASLRFGPLRHTGSGPSRLPGHQSPPARRLPQPADTDAAAEERSAHNRHLFRGVVGGIGGHRNRPGLPPVGGGVSVSPPPPGNPP